MKAVSTPGSHVDAKTYPLQDILKPERRYVIPTFQRDYEWTLDGQWKLLFEDLASTADRLLEVRLSGEEGSKLKAKEQSVSPHFLGAIVCAGLPFATGGVALRSVIDGQQRLTTVQLLIRGLADVLKETSSERTKTVRRMLFNPDDVVESPEEVYKLWPRRRDRELWPVAMGDNVPDYQQAASHRYLQARQYFAAAARDYAMEDAGIDRVRLVALADALASLFKLVVIDLDDNDDAQVIFEVLNGRQTPLSAIDLVKNLLFLRGELAEVDVEKLYDTYWAFFDDDWWKETVGRGHAQRGRRDVLLSVWLTAVTGNEANVGHLYREAREYLANGPDTETILKQLSEYARAYQTIYEALPAQDERLLQVYKNLRALEITTAIPLLTWLRTLTDEQLPHTDHVRAARAVESWAMRRVYVGAQTRGYGSFLTRVLREAKAAAASGSNVADAVVAALSAGALPWPTDADLLEAFLTRKFYDSMSQMRLRLLLGAIDRLLRSEDQHEPAASINYDNLQIEHVLPRAWHQHWPICDEGVALNPDDSDPRWIARSDQRRRVIDSIGNLTLVTGTFNRGVSNLGWATKRAEFEKQKSLVINYSLARSSQWDEAAILERAGNFAGAVSRLWPSAEALMEAQ